MQHSSTLLAWVWESELRKSNIYLVVNITTAIGRKEAPALSWFSKAFDIIDHKIYLPKLYSYEIGDTAHNWLFSYTIKCYKKEKVYFAWQTISIHLSDSKSVRGPTKIPFWDLLFFFFMLTIWQFPSEMEK